ncbi:MAG: HAD-IC family P-type ATPase [Coleofasciculaceae cyanobacterium SM2_3_26]|nr:HAD-IC family P-type ATPase [Coleofasciculaceae cyanobacterium SM2_3_26]
MFVIPKGCVLVFPQRRDLLLEREKCPSTPSDSTPSPEDATPSSRGRHANATSHEDLNDATLWHSLDTGQAVEKLQSDRHLGLNQEQISQRLATYGLNEIEEVTGRSTIAIFIDQFKNIMLVMLIAVAVVSGILDFQTQEFPKDAIAIMLIVLLNGILGFLQESRAEKALAALKNLASPQVRVLRNGVVTEISSKHVVPGDIMLLEAGVQVAADGRLLETSNLKIRESALTGEANPAGKVATDILEEDTSLGDRTNMVFQGTEVVNGRGKAVITGTGMRTELGRIASMIQSVESEMTPLQQRMNQLANVLVSGSLVLVAIVVVGGTLAKLGNFTQLLEVSLSMAVAVVPEGLPAVITVTLALGTQRMVRRQALIRRLPAVETLGSVTTICSDKTGTLTQNKMVAQQVHTQSHTFIVSGEGYEPDGEFMEMRGFASSFEQEEERAAEVQKGGSNIISGGWERQGERE